MARNRHFVDISVRQERPVDAPAITKVIQRAYEKIPFSNHREHLMVERLRASQAYVPQLSLVAEDNGKIVGHLLLTRITIWNGERSTLSLALAPLSVAPEFQRRGIGGALINEAHRQARLLGYRSIIVIGIEGYYPRFGYMPLALSSVKLPFKVRPENCAIISLCTEKISDMRGMVEYAPEWMEIAS